MKNVNKKAIIFVYVIILANIAIILAMVIINNSYVFFNLIQNQKIIQKSYNNIYSNSNIVFNLAKFYNSNGNGFTDNISCPSSVFMSGTTNSGVINTNIKYSTGIIYCLGNYNGSDINIFYNSGFTDFSGATYSGSYSNLISGSGTFTDYDNTKIDFLISGLSGIDNLDDDFNSDNYLVNSSGSYFYPDNYEDDDVIHRKKIYGFIDKLEKNKNIFGNNLETNEIISNNNNNDDYINSKISETSTGIAFLNTDRDYDLKIVKFDKSMYDTKKELIPIQTHKGKNNTSGYIQKSVSGSLYSNSSKTGNEYIFDFVNNYYGIFIDNNFNDIIKYNLYFENESGSGVYIVPIDDTTDNLKFLGSYIYNDLGKYNLNQYFVIGKK